MKKYNIKVNGVSYEVEVEEIGDDVQSTSVSTAPVKVADIPVKASVNSSPAGVSSIKSPMPGNIVKINVKSGDSVKKGDVLLVLETMKMENDITAPADCVISSVSVSQGATVATGDVLVTYN